ncbi:MAG TPA: Fe-S cluster assembly protein SufD [Anaeromyxobacter sp.]|nr:Fe-S cluster assembly protein SufD [Anaeromyxobacter sp.]
MTPAERSLAAAFAPRPGEAAWLADARRAALARFEALGLPTARHEDWRFTSLSGLAPLELRPAAPEAPDAAALLARAPAPDGARLVFVNGRYRPELSTRRGLPKAAVVSTLAEALRERPDAVRPHLGRLARPDDHAFVAANAALFEDGAFVQLPPGGALDAPIALVFLSGGPAGAGAWGTHPRSLVLAGAGARATIEEIYLGGGGPYLTNAVTELVLGEGAAVEHVRLQLESAAAFHVSSVHAEEAAGARLAAHAFTLGGRLARAEVRARLAGEGSQIAANGLYMASGDQIVDNFSWVEHEVPSCTTTETFKGILDGRARGVFAGRIRVLPGAQKTQAHQMNSNLLLSDDAIVDTKPQLEIFADDVKCGHGGTVGQLDDAALFYLRSRGIAEAEAKSLLVWAFASEMVGLVGTPSLRARAKNLVAARLPAGARLLEAA